MIGLDEPGYTDTGIQRLDDDSRSPIDDLIDGYAPETATRSMIEYLLNCEPETAYDMLVRYIKLMDAYPNSMEAKAIKDMNKWFTDHPEEL